MDDITNITYTIAKQVTEETDKFIFETIRPYCEEQSKIIVSKELLKRALICFKEEHYDEYITLQKMAESEE